MKLTNKERAWGYQRSFKTRWKPGELWRRLNAAKARRLAKETVEPKRRIRA